METANEEPDGEASGVARFPGCEGPGLMNAHARSRRWCHEHVIVCIACDHRVFRRLHHPEDWKVPSNPAQCEICVERLLMDKHSDPLR
jgi:hypothetical protein